MASVKKRFRDLWSFFTTYEKVWFFSILILAVIFAFVFPEEDVTLLDIPTTTAEEMSRMMTLRMVDEVEFPANVRSVSIGLDEERGQTAWYTEVL